MKTPLAATVAALGKLIAGIQQHQPNAVFMTAGKSVTAAEAVTTLQALIAAFSALISAHSAVHEAVVTADNLSTVNQEFVRDIKLNIQMLYADTASVLSDFGLAPRKVAVLTPAQKIARAEKAKATRAARHTMGKKQKAAITGATPAATTSSAVPTAAATPAVAPLPQGSVTAAGGTSGTSTH